MPYEKKDGKFYLDRSGSLRTINWKDDDDLFSKHAQTLHHGSEGCWVTKGGLS